MYENSDAFANNLEEVGARKPANIFVYLSH